MCTPKNLQELLYSSSFDTIFKLLGLPHTKKLCLAPIGIDSQLVRLEPFGYSYYVIFYGNINTFSSIYNGCIIGQDHHLT